MFHKIKRIFFLICYYGIVRFLPHSGFPYLGGIFKYLRYLCVKNIFKFCGKNVNIEQGAWFGNGRDIMIGDNSGIGYNSVVPNNTKIGNNVMMGPNVHIFIRDHKFDRLDIPMIEQGYTEDLPCVIGDDVWIGMNVVVLPGKTIKRGTVIAANTVVTKDFPEYSVIGGTPGKLIKFRK